MDADLFPSLQSLRSPEEAPPAAGGSSSPPDIREVRSAATMPGACNVQICLSSSDEDEDEAPAPLVAAAKDADREARKAARRAEKRASKKAARKAAKRAAKLAARKAAAAAPAAAAAAAAPAPAVAPAAAPAAPMTAAEALRLAAAEGLELQRRASNTTGFVGIYKNFGSKTNPYESSIPRRCPATNRYPQHLGTFATAEEAALVRARALANAPG